MLLTQGQICGENMAFMCLFAVLGSQGIVVKCTAAIFFRTVDWGPSDRNTSAGLSMSTFLKVGRIL